MSFMHAYSSMGQERFRQLVENGRTEEKRRFVFFLPSRKKRKQNKQGCRTGCIIENACVCNVIFSRPNIFPLCIFSQSKVLVFQRPEWSCSRCCWDFQQLDTKSWPFRFINIQIKGERLAHFFSLSIRLGRYWFFQRIDFFFSKKIAPQFVSMFFLSFSRPRERCGRALLSFLPRSSLPSFSKHPSWRPCCALAQYWSFSERASLTLHVGLSSLVSASPLECEDRKKKTQNSDTLLCWSGRFSSSVLWFVLTVRNEERRGESVH